MDITFDSATQYLEFKQVYLDKMEIIYNPLLLNQITVTMELLLRYMKTGALFGGLARKKSKLNKKNIKKSKK